MRRRKLRWVAAGLALVALLAAVAFVQWPRPNRLARQNLSRIQAGMSRPEVVAILGPPGDYTTGPISSLRPAIRMASDEWWVADEGTYWVRFDGQGRVPPVDGSGFWANTELESPSPRGSAFGWRLRRLWREWFP
jgi:hypothetical protein